MPRYKLYYFNFRGRAEYIRLIFAYARVQYEDRRIRKGEEWQEMKSKMPFAQIPVLEVDGKDMIPQSVAIGRFLGKKYDLYGTNDLEAARIDALVDQVEQTALPLVVATRTKVTNPSSAEDLETLFDTLLYRLSLLEAQLEISNTHGGQGYFMGDLISLADLSFYQHMTWTDVLELSVPWERYPYLTNLRSKVENIPAIRSWLDTRPDTTY